MLYDRVKVRIYINGLIAALALLIVALLLLGGRSARPVHAFITIDNSQGVSPYLATYAKLSARLAAQLEPDQDSLTMTSMNFETVVFYDGSGPQSIERILPAILKELKNVPARPGTFPAKFWKQVAERAEHSDKSVFIALFSDGDNDDQTPESAAAIRSAARRLADNPRVVSVALIGVNPQNRSYLYDCFAPLGEHLHVCGPTELDSEALLQLLNGVRQ